MNKFLAMILTLVMMLALAACGNAVEVSSESNTLEPVAAAGATSQPQESVIATTEPAQTTPTPTPKR